MYPHCFALDSGRQLHMECKIVKYKVSIEKAVKSPALKISVLFFVSLSSVISVSLMVSMV